MFYDVPQFLISIKKTFEDALEESHLKMTPAAGSDLSVSADAAD